MDLDEPDVGLVAVMSVPPGTPTEPGCANCADTGELVVTAAGDAEVAGADATGALAAGAALEPDGYIWEYRLGLVETIFLTKFPLSVLGEHMALPVHGFNGRSGERTGRRDAEPVARHAERARLFVGGELAGQVGEDVADRRIGRRPR